MFTYQSVKLSDTSIIREADYAENSNSNLQPAPLRSHLANESRVSLGSHYSLIDS